MEHIPRPDAIVQRALDRFGHLPQFEKLSGKKFRHCKLCGKKLQAGEEYRTHMMRHW